MKRCRDVFSKVGCHGKSRKRVEAVRQRKSPSSLPRSDADLVKVTDTFRVCWNDSLAVRTVQHRDEKGPTASSSSALRASPPSPPLISRRIHATMTSLTSSTHSTGFPSSDSENYSTSPDDRQSALSPEQESPPPSSSSSPLILYSPPTFWSILRGAGINLLLPFVNGLMLGFGELVAHEWAWRLGWGGTKVSLEGWIDCDEGLNYRMGAAWVR